jgi:O-antigen/teichoic acid export membrane protein
LAIVPIWTHHLGIEDFGLWSMAIALTTTAIAIADLGLGAAMISPLAALYVRGDHIEMRQLIRQVKRSLIKISVAWCVIITLLAIAGVYQGYTAYRLAVFLAPLVVVVCALPFSMAPRLWQAVGSFKGSAAIDILAALAHLLLIGLVVMLGLGLLSAVCVLVLASSAANMIAWWWWWRKYALVEADATAVEYSSWHGSAGMPFLVLQICAVALSAVDPLIVGGRLSAGQAGEYAAVSRWFMLAQSGFSLLVLPLWPAISTAIAQGDLRWVRKTVHRATILVSCSGIVIFAAWAAAGWLAIPLWTGGKVVPDQLLLTMSALACMVVNGGAVYAMYLNGSGSMRIQVIICLVLAPAVLFLKWWTLGFGLVWLVPASGALAYFICALVPYFIHSRHVLPDKPASS